MDYEKKYKDALKRAKELSKRQSDITTMEYIFPELKESEDEKIKNSLLRLVKSNSYTHIAGIQINDVIAWLEKQREIDKESYEIAEKEKYDFVSGQFIECRKSFNEFKEDNSYWLEYIGNDNYIGRSDNILNKTFHITPRQLFTLFTVEHCPKNDEYKESDDERIRKALISVFSNREKYLIDQSFGDITVSEALTWLKKQGHNETALNKDDEDKFEKPNDGIEEKPNGGIVLEDCSEGDGFYKVNLAYLSKEQVEEIENIVKKWNPELECEDERIKACIGMCLTDACEQRFKDYNTSLKDCLAWIEKQGTHYCL